MRLRPRARLLALAFGGYFLVVSAAAYAYAEGTTGPWFVGLPALGLYGMSFLGGLVLLIGLALLVAFLVRAPVAGNPLGDLSGLDARLAAMEARIHATEEVRAEVSEEEVDSLLEALAQTADPQVWFEETKEDRIDREIRGVKEDMRALREGLAALRSGRPDPLEEGRRRVRFRRIVYAVLGPALAAAVVLGVSAMMLPGIEGFSASNYVLSNALALAVAYNWLGLALYAVLSMMVAAHEAR